MTLTIRRLEEADVDTAMWTFTTAMQFAPLSGDALELARSRAYPERSFGSFDGTTMVGHTRSFPFVTVVPGGARLATAGVTAVGTLPTHRRQGILGQVMRAQLHDCHERGEPLASLRASESLIYSRFGYGVAGHALHFVLDTRRGRLRQRREDPGSFAFERGPQLEQFLQDLHRRCLRRPGEVERPWPVWQRMLGSLLKPQQDEARWLVVHRDAKGRRDGYVEWESSWNHDAPEPEVRIEVGDLYGTDSHVEALLWQFLLDLDLVRRITIESRPMDDPVRWQLTDMRALAVKEVWDEQWMRLVDVDAALAARTYNDVPGSVVLAVTDPVLPHNDGRYEIDAAGARRVRRAADLDVPIDALGAIYLGGTSVTELVAAGRIGERRRGAAARADLLLHSLPAPWCGTFF
jgi:predicted acetyltransferase